VVSASLERADLSSSRAKRVTNVGASQTSQECGAETSIRLAVLCFAKRAVNGELLIRLWPVTFRPRRTSRDLFCADHRTVLSSGPDQSFLLSRIPADRSDTRISSSTQTPDLSSVHSARTAATVSAVFENANYRISSVQTVWGSERKRSIERA